MFKIFAYIFVVIQILLYLFFPSFDPTIGSFSLVFFGFILVLYFIEGKSVDKTLYTSWLRPTYLLLISLIIVNFQSIINALLHLAPMGDYLKNEVYAAYTSPVLSLSLACTTAFLIGNSHITKPFTKRDDYTGNVQLTLNVWTLLATVFFILFVQNIDLYRFLSGLDYENSGAADRIMSSSSYYEQLLTTAIIIVLAIYTKTLDTCEHISLGTYLKKLPKLFLIVSGLYMTLRLLSGDRGPVIYTFCAYLYSYLMASKAHIKFRYVAVLLVAGAIGVTLLGVARDLNKDMDFAQRIKAATTEMKAADEVPTISSATQELANSVNCTFIAVQDIKQKKTEYRMGEYNFYALIGSIPGSSFVLTKFFGVNLRDKMSSEYITVSHFGPYYPLGLGTSAVADLYLDFGIIGAVIVFLLMGIFYRKIDYEYVYAQTAGLSIFWMIIVLKISSYSIYTPRSCFSSTISAALYIAILYFVVNLFVSKMSSRK